VRIATEFISPSVLEHIAGVPIQIVLDYTTTGVERMQIRANAEAACIREKLLAHEALANAMDAALLVVEVIACVEHEFIRNKHSGKTPLIVDRRI
jgi:phenylacetate-CoA ligase